MEAVNWSFFIEVLWFFYLKYRRENPVNLEGQRKGGDQMKTLLVKLGVILIGFAVLGYGEVSGQEKYLCVPDLATGFRYNKSSRGWEQANFKTDHKYIISKSDDKKSTYFKVNKIGEIYPWWGCAEGFNESGFLFCSGIGGEFKFNKKNGRYILANLIGYFVVLSDSPLFPTDEKSDTPFIEIGKCSPF